MLYPFGAALHLPNLVMVRNGIGSIGLFRSLGFPDGVCQIVLRSDMILERLTFDSEFLGDAKFGFAAFYSGFDTEALSVIADDASHLCMMAGVPEKVQFRHVSGTISGTLRTTFNRSAVRTRELES